MTASPTIDAFFDEATFTVTYLVSDAATGRAAIIDPVRDYDHKAGKASTAASSTSWFAMVSGWRWAASR